MMSRKRQIHPVASAERSLWQDAVFWWALLLGMTCCGLAAWLLGMPGGMEAFEQWRRLAWLVLLYPLLEEWLFRGLLQPVLLKAQSGQRSWCGVTLANVVTSVVFTATHFLMHTPLWALMVLLPSLLFGWFRDRYRSILPAVILHSGYNLAYFLSFGMPG